MVFEYVQYEGNWLPLVPVSLRSGKYSLPPIGALVDTGATHTILPMEMAPELGINISLAEQIESQIAGGGECFVYPSLVNIEYSLQDPNSQNAYRWKGKVCFALGQKCILLGHRQCLEKFDVTFHGPERMLEVTARFRKRS